MMVLSDGPGISETRRKQPPVYAPHRWVYALSREGRQSRRMLCVMGKAAVIDEAESLRMRASYMFQS